MMNPVVQGRECLYEAYLSQPALLKAEIEKCRGQIVVMSARVEPFVKALFDGKIIAENEKEPIKALLNAKIERTKEYNGLKHNCLLTLFKKIEDGKILSQEEKDKKPRIPKDQKMKILQDKIKKEAEDFLYEQLKGKIPEIKKENPVDQKIDQDPAAVDADIAKVLEMSKNDPKNKEEADLAKALEISKNQKTPEEVAIAESLEEEQKRIENDRKVQEAKIELEGKPEKKENVSLCKRIWNAVAKFFKWLGNLCRKKPPVEEVQPEVVNQDPKPPKPPKVAVAIAEQNNGIQVHVEVVEK